MSDMLSEILKLNHCKLEEQPVKYHLMESKVCWSAKRFLKKIKSKSHHQLYHWKQEKQPTMEKKKKHNLFCLLVFLGWQRFEKKIRFTSCKTLKDTAQMESGAFNSLVSNANAVLTYFFPWFFYILGSFINQVILHILTEKSNSIKMWFIRTRKRLEKIQYPPVNRT